MYVVIKNFRHKFIVDPYYDDYCWALRSFLEFALDLVDAALDSEEEFEELEFKKFTRDDSDKDILKKAIEDKLNVKVKDLEEIASFFASTPDHTKCAFLLKVVTE